MWLTGVAENGSVQVLSVIDFGGTAEPTCCEAEMVPLRFDCWNGTQVLQSINLGSDPTGRPICGARDFNGMVSVTSFAEKTLVAVNPARLTIKQSARAPSPP
jgi:hypothetical protein